MTTRPAFLSPQFDTLEQQHATRVFGMWVFLLTELLLFGALFTAYIAYRFAYPGGFAEGSQHLDANLGAINTAVLITSSLTMALAVHSAQRGKRKALALFLSLTLILGAAFLGIKAIEYTRHYQERLAPGVSFEYTGAQAHAVELFFMLYFAMTAVHAIHLTIGIGLVAAMLILTWRGRVSQVYWTPIELTGLYWHFVDIIWVFLFPLLYLVRG